MREKNNFRTWKSGKKWLYSVTALAALAGGALVSPTLVSPQIVAKADTASQQQDAATPVSQPWSTTVTVNLDPDTGTGATWWDQNYTFSVSGTLELNYDGVLGHNRLHITGVTATAGTDNTDTNTNSGFIDSFYILPPGETPTNAPGSQTPTTVTLNGNDDVPSLQANFDASNYILGFWHQNHTLSEGQFGPKAADYYVDVPDNGQPTQFFQIVNGLYAYATPGDKTSAKIRQWGITDVVGTTVAVPYGIYGVGATDTTPENVADTVNNVIEPSVTQDPSDPTQPGVQATISGVTVNSVTSDNGTTVQPSAITADTAGNVTLPAQSKSGTYTINLTYTDSNGQQVSVTDVITVTPSTTFVDTDGNTINPPVSGSNQPAVDVPGYYNPVKTTDPNTGNTVWTYTQVTTSFVDGDGKTLKPTVNGDQPSTDIPGYQKNPTKTTDSNGNVTWTYNQITTSYVDNNGKTLKPTVDGDQPSIDIPGYQTPTKSTDPNGNTVWTYTPTTTPNASTTTSYVDNNGKTLKPTVDGNQPAIDIPGYQTPTKSTDSNGNTVWTYTPIPTPGTSTITSFVDGDGKTLKPSVDGNQPATDIPGYQKNPTKTTDKNGNTVWTYKKITTSFVDGDGNPIAPQVEGEQPSEKITGYELVNKTTDANGNIVYHYKALVSPTTTATPTATPTTTPTAQPSNSGSSFQATTADSEGKILPHTGIQDDAKAVLAGVLFLTGAVVLGAMSLRRRKRG